MTEKKTVLIVDDDRVLRTDFGDLLSRQGYRVFLAENGAAGIKVLEQTTIDTVFLDVMMPEKDGLETLMHIKQNFPAMPVVVMSGGGTRSKQDFLSIAEKLGATATLRKPFAPGEPMRILGAQGGLAAPPKALGRQ